MPFGNYKISFDSVSDVTLGQVFGTQDLKPNEMTKKLWDFIKKNKLNS